MSAESIEAGKAFVELLVKDAAFRKGIDGSLKRLDAFGKSIQSISAKMGVAGLAISAPFIGAVHTFANLGSELLNLSKRTGQSVESLSQMKFIAEQSGSSIEDVVSAVGKLEKAMYGAAHGNKEAATAFESLGLSADTLLSLAPDEAFARVASAISKIPEPTAKAALAMAVFGKGGAALLPVIDNYEELRDLAPKMSREQAEAAHKLEVAFAAIKAGAVDIAITIATQLVPGVEDGAKSIRGIVEAINKWISVNPELVKGIAAIGEAMAGLSAIAVVGSGLRTISSLANGLKILGARLLANPIALALAAIGAAVYGLAYALGETVGPAEDADKSLTHLLDNAITKVKELREEVAKLDPNATGMDKAWNDTVLHNLALAQQDAEQLLHTMMQIGTVPFGFGPAGFSGGGVPRMPAKPETTFAAGPFEKGAGTPGAFGLGFFGGPFGTLQGMARFAMNAAIEAQAQDNIFQNHHGLPGFDSPPQVKGIQQTIGGLSTFNGAIASQIFGGPGSVSQLLTQGNKERQKHTQLLNDINQKLGPRGVDNRLKFGIA